MNLCSHIILKTLDVVFDENQSAYARAVNIDDSNLRRDIDDARKGKGSPRLMEQTMEMLAVRGYRLADLLDGYQLLPQENQMCEHSFLAEKIRVSISAHAHQLDKFQSQGRIFGLLDELLSEIENHQCGIGCAKEALCGVSLSGKAKKVYDADCPYGHIKELLKWVNKVPMSEL